MTRSICAIALALLSTLASGQAPLQPAPEAPMPMVLQKYKSVRAERLKQPEDGSWLMIRRTYDGWGYSPLDQITPANVARLKPVWGFATGEGRAHESDPGVNNGVLFITTAHNE